MSGLKPPQMSDFYRSLRGRGVTTEILADLIGVSRPTLCRVLNGGRRRGPVWAKVEPLLTPQELGLLDVAHCHPWNKKRAEKRPRWSKPLLQRLREYFSLKT